MATRLVVSLPLEFGDERGLAPKLALVRREANVKENVVQKDLLVACGPVDAAFDGARSQATDPEPVLLEEPGNLLVNFFAFQLTSFRAQTL